ncbi:MAG TPA: hypothetical protein VI819_01490 [Patescibacteria group bacterium]|nr:hypothetical protein [Patescibacteria group bacterium]
MAARPENDQYSTTINWKSNKQEILGRKGPANDSEFGGIVINPGNDLQIRIEADTLILTSNRTTIFLNFPESVQNTLQKMTPTPKSLLKVQGYFMQSDLPEEIKNAVIEMFNVFDNI